QSSVPLCFLVVPFAAVMCYCWFLYSDQNTPLMKICFLVMSFHGVVHSIALIFTTPILRKRLFKMFREITYPNASLQLQISVVGTR
ncbi:hypothetical protein PENTCL1PPCAC_3176, partial [Pristionchus entomophagus]